MQRIFGIAAICGLIWLGMTLFSEGTEGVLGWLPGRESPPTALEGDGALDRLRERGEQTRERQRERLERQLGQLPD